MKITIKGAEFKEPISKNFIRGCPIVDVWNIMDLANNKESIYHPYWGIVPAAYIQNMNLRMILNMIQRRSLYYIFKKEK